MQKANVLRLLNDPFMTDDYGRLNVMDGFTVGTTAVVLERLAR